MQEEQGSNNFFASALDLLTCGLGGTALLFILFSTVKSVPKKAGGVSNYLNVCFEVVASTKPVLLTPILIPPDGKPIEVPIQLFDQKSGRMQTSGPLAEKFSREIKALQNALGEDGQCSLVGFSVDGQGTRHPINRVFSLHLSNPLPGAWQVRASFFNSDRNSVPSKADRVEVRTIATTRHQRQITKGEAVFGKKTPPLPAAILIKEK